MRNTHSVRLLAFAALALTGRVEAEEEPGHTHGPDGRHVAVAGASGGPMGKSILSHHDLMVLDTRRPGKQGGKVVEGCDIHSVVYRKGDRTKPVHKEHNAYEPENGVYGSHMMYREPGEYEIVESVKMPDGKEYTLTFPIWVPDPHPHKDAGASRLPAVLAVIGGLLLLAGAYWLGRRSGRREASIISVLAIVASVAPWSLASAQEEEGHMHGPDGRHVAVASKFGEVPEPLMAFPTPDRKDSAEQRVDHYLFRLTIENEELAPPDPDVVTVPDSTAKAIGLTVVPAASQRVGGGITTTGQVRPNPDRSVTVNSRVAGRIVSISLTPGEQVRAGQTAAVLDSTEIADAQAQYRHTLTGVQEAEAGSRRARAQVAEAQAQLDRARADLQAARTKVIHSQGVLKRQKDMAASGEFSQHPVEEARSAVAAAEGEVQTARTALGNLAAQTRRLEAGVKEGLVARKDVESAQAAESQGKTRLSTAERQLQIARAALAREERIQSQGLRNAREVQQAQADLDAAQLAAKSAEAIVASQSRTVQAMRASERAALAELDHAREEVGSAVNRLRLLGARPGGGNQITITIPIGGEVETRPVNIGETVQAGQVIATIVNRQTVWVESDVFEKDLPRVRPGQRVTIAADADPGRTYEGSVSYIGGQVNPDTRAVRVRTVVANPGGRLRPNMFVRVMIGSGDGGSTVTVPQEALQEDGAEQVVFLEEAPGSYRRKPVRAGPNMGDHVVIEDGVKPGDKVVTRGAYQLLSLAKKG